LIHNAEELQSYSKTEEDRLEGIVKGIADAGVQVVAAGSAFGEMALHFIEKYKMMAVRIPSKFELRRFCRCSHPHRTSPPVVVTPELGHFPACHCCAQYTWSWR